MFFLPSLNSLIEASYSLGIYFIFFVYFVELFEWFCLEMLVADCAFIIKIDL